MLRTISTIHRLASMVTANVSIFAPLRKGFVASDMTLFTHATAFPGLSMTFARRTSSWPSHLELLSSRETIALS